MKTAKSQEKKHQTILSYLISFQLGWECLTKSLQENITWKLQLVSVFQKIPYILLGHSGHTQALNACDHLDK